MDYEFSKDKEYCYNFVFFRKGLNDLIYSRCLINVCCNRWTPGTVPDT